MSDPVQVPRSVETPVGAPYVPFLDEWKHEMMKNTKATIIDIAAAIGRERDGYRCSAESSVDMIRTWRARYYEANKLLERVFAHMHGFNFDGLRRGHADEEACHRNWTILQSRIQEFLQRMSDINNHLTSRMLAESGVQHGGLDPNKDKEPPTMPDWSCLCARGFKCICPVHSHEYVPEERAHDDV